MQWWRQRSRKAKILLIIGAIVALFALIGALAPAMETNENGGAHTTAAAPQPEPPAEPEPPPPPPPPPPDPAYSEDDPAYQLAFIDAEGDEPDDATVARYARVLDRLGRKCRENRRKLADMSVRATQILADEKGLDYTTMEMLRNANTAVPKELGRTKCADIFAAS